MDGCCVIAYQVVATDGWTLCDCLTIFLIFISVNKMHPKCPWPILHGLTTSSQPPSSSHCIHAIVGSRPDRVGSRMPRVGLRDAVARTDADFDDPDAPPTTSREDARQAATPCLSRTIPFLCRAPFPPRVCPSPSLSTSRSPLYLTGCRCLQV